MKADGTIYKKFNLSDSRYNILFGPINIWGIFQPSEYICNYADSNFYNLIYTKEFTCNSIQSVITDIKYMNRSGSLILKFNDVIVIKINGAFFYYRFCGGDSFTEIYHFVDKEKTDYIYTIHRERMVLSLLDGFLYKLSNKKLLKNKVYCIQEEFFRLTNNTIVSNYSLFSLNSNNDMYHANPHGVPFMSMKNAAFYFHGHGESNSLLLLNKKELNMIRDLRELKQVELVS